MKRIILSIMDFLSADAREKLIEVMKRNEIEGIRKGIEYCIELVWFGQIGQYQEISDENS